MLLASRERAAKLDHGLIDTPQRRKTTPIHVTYVRILRVCGQQCPAFACRASRFTARKTRPNGLQSFVAPTLPEFSCHNTVINQRPRGPGSLVKVMKR